MQGLLAGKLALVTGASRGVGQAIAEAFAVEKARVVLTAEAGQEAELHKVCKRPLKLELYVRHHESKCAL